LYANCNHSKIVHITRACNTEMMSSNVDAKKSTQVMRRHCSFNDVQFRILKSSSLDDVLRGLVSRNVRSIVNDTYRTESVYDQVTLS